MIRYNERMMQEAAKTVVIGMRAPMWMHVSEQTMTQKHALPAARLVIPLDDAPVHYVVGERRWTSTTPVVLGIHAAVAIGSPGQVVSLFFDSRDTFSRRLGPVTRRKSEGGGPSPSIVFDDKCGRALTAIAAAAADHIGDQGEAIAQELAGVVNNGTSESLPPLDRRVESAAEQLETNPANAWSMVSLARSVGLSPSRLAHLFQRDLHVSARSLALYVRAFAALGNANTYGNLAHAAAAFGFADQSHLARATRSIFGQPANYAVRSRIVQA